MINKQFLLNTHKLGEEKNLVSAYTMDAGRDIGCPCIVNKEYFEQTSENSYIPVLFTIFDGSLGYISESKKKHIIINNSRCIAHNNIKQIETFDFDKVDKISKYVKNKGSALFSLFTQNPICATKATNQSALNFVDGLYAGIFAKYRYHSIINAAYQVEKPTIFGDLRYIIYFVDIPCCLPVLNRYKVDGMGFMLSMVSLSETHERESASFVCSISAILSNYRENAFVIDGVDIRKQKPLEAEYIIDMKQIIKNNLKGKRRDYLFKSKENKSKPEKNLYTTIDVSTIDAARYWVNISNSNTYVTFGSDSSTSTSSY